MESVSKATDLDRVRKLERQLGKAVRQRKVVRQRPIGQLRFETTRSVTRYGGIKTASKFVLRRAFGAAGPFLIPSGLGRGTVDLNNPKWSALYTPGKPDATVWRQVDTPAGKVFVPKSVPLSVRRELTKGLYSPSPDVEPYVPTVRRPASSAASNAAHIRDTWGKLSARLEQQYEALQKTYEGLRQSLGEQRDSSTSFYERQQAGLQDLRSSLQIDYSKWSVPKTDFPTKREAEAYKRKQEKLRKERRRLEAQQKKAAKELGRQLEKLKDALKRLKRRQLRNADKEIARLKREIAKTRKRIKETEVKKPATAQPDLEPSSPPRKPGYKPGLVDPLPGDLSPGLRPGSEPGKQPGSEPGARPGTLPGGAEDGPEGLPSGRPEWPSLPDVPGVPGPAPGDLPAGNPGGVITIGVTPSGKVSVRHEGRNSVSPRTRFSRPRRNDRKQAAAYRTALLIINRTYGELSEFWDLQGVLMDSIEPAGVAFNRRLWRDGPNGTLQPKDWQSAVALLSSGAAEINFAQFAKGLLFEHIEDWLFSLQPDRGFYDIHKRPVGTGFGLAL